MLDGAFASMLKSVGVPHYRGNGGASLCIKHFVGEVKASGLVMKLLEKHHITGQLSVAV